ncbi:hypothetical protein KCP78_21575 [Salmonella enterica subsp. enterica]|nr:hypothetical protein KCP78_21575 [Salmonella enterica subsp. enterica]
MEEMLQEFFCVRQCSKRQSGSAKQHSKTAQAKATQASKQNDAEKVLPQPINKIPALAKMASVKIGENQSSMPEESVKGNR